MSRTPAGFAGCFAWLALLSCGQATPAPKALPRPETTQSSVVMEATIASVPNGTVGPYLARNKDRALVLWAEPSAEGDVSWLLRTLDHHGRPTGAARRVAQLEAAPALVKLRPFGAGYLAVWSSNDGGQAKLSSLNLGADGTLLAPMQTLTQVDAEVLWLDVVATNNGGLVLWAERRGSSATVLAHALDPNGTVTSQQATLHARARAWQVAEVEDGAVLAVSNEQRRVEVIKVSAAAEVLHSEEVPNSEQVSSGLDLLRRGDRLLLGFVATPLLDPTVFVAVLALDGTVVRTPHAAVPALGRQRLVRLVGGERSYLAWQDADQAPSLLKVTELAGDGSGSGNTLLLRWDETSQEPEFSTQNNQLRILNWSCIAELNCNEPKVPNLIELDDVLTPRSVSPWLLEGKVPDLGWDLQCEASSCLGLVALFGDRTQVYAAGTHKPSGEWLTPAWNEPQEAPALRARESLLTPLPLSAFDVIANSEGHLLAWLSYFDPSLPYVKPKTPAPDGRLAPVQAQLHTQWVPADVGASAPERTLPADTVISYRARSLGGVALAQGSKNQLLVWAAIDGNSPKVFTTLLDTQGKKVAQQMLSRQKGEVTSVTALSANAEWLVGWIDDRSGKPRPHLTRITDRLARKLPDTPLGNEQSNASSLSLSLVGTEVWALRTEEQAGGKGAIVLSRLDAKNLKTLAEVTLTAGDAHYHSAMFVRGAKNPLVTWIREDQAGAQLAVTPLKENGEALAGPFVWKSTHAVVTSSAECEAERCRLLATTESDEAQFVEALRFNESGLNQGRLLGNVLSTEALAVSPQLQHGEGWIYDVSVQEQPRLQRLRLVW